jgi:glyoxylase-like metal-dependent hydrolase (beta-lactamase superfamily II)
VIVRQICVGRLAVFAYVVGCEKTKKAVLIDPAAEVDRTLDVVAEEGLEVELVINTHPHPDHTSGNRKAVERTGASLAVHKDAASALGGAMSAVMSMMTGGERSPAADRELEDGEVIEVGEVKLRVIETPGHSHGGICLYGHGAVFTGDILFVGAVGRTDLPGGSMAKLKDSLRTKLLTLPEETVVYPGHDYGSRPTSTVGDEKRENPYA